MILDELNQLLRESVMKAATQDAIKLDKKQLEQVEFETVSYTHLRAHET